MANSFDPASAASAGRLVDAYAEAARSGPVQRVAIPGVGEVWLVTGWAEVRQALADPRLHKAPSGPQRLTARVRPDLSPALRHMLTRDGEAHARLRRLITAAFTRHQVQALEPRVVSLTEELLDGLATAGPDATVDLMESFAFPLPLAVIFEILGVPLDWRAEIHRCFTSVFAASYVPDEEFAAALDRLVELSRAVVELRRADPGDDLLTALIEARDAGDRLSEDELIAMIVLLLGAGHETTTNLIGNGVRSLLAHPQQRDLLRADPVMAVEELLRFDPPLQMTFPLRATGDVELGAVHIAEGDLVFVGLLAANRDDVHFTGATELKLNRAPNQHLTFGHGPHHCVGAALARLEGRIALTRLVERFPDLRVAGDALVGNPSLMFNGLAALPVVLGAQAQS